MPTECSPELFEFPPVEGRAVVAGFDGGAITSDAGALLLGQTDRAIRLSERFAACFADTRTAELVEHQVETLVMQRVVGIALGYEDLNDHDDLRRSNIDAAAGAVEEIARVVAQIRRRWPRTRTLLRGDSGFTRQPLMAWCEANRVDYVFGLARNDRLEQAIVAELVTATIETIRTGKTARCFKDFSYTTRDSWSRARR